MIGDPENTENLNHIQSRGCAYVIMKSRASAFKAMQELQASRERSSKRKVDWGMFSGIKDSDFADFWDKGQGAAFIPYEKLPQDIQVGIYSEISFNNISLGAKKAGPWCNDRYWKYARKYAKRPSGMTSSEIRNYNFQTQTATLNTNMDMDMDMDVDKGMIW